MEMPNVMMIISKWHKVAAATCLHNCIPDACGGDRKTGNGCRFSFPKKLLKSHCAGCYAGQSRPNGTTDYFEKNMRSSTKLESIFPSVFRANHDFSVLISHSHSMRYATKYASKSAKHNDLLNDMVDHLRSRSMDIMPPTMKQVLSNLILADCSHRSFMTKQELSYKVMGLPDVRRSFPKVEVVGFYRRAKHHGRFG